MKRYMYVLVTTLVCCSVRADSNARKVFQSVKDKLVIVQCDDCAGSGFLVEMGGKKYMVTNEHVVNGQKRVAAFLLNGKKIALGKFAVASDGRDLVRFEVATNTPALLVREGVPNVSEPVFVFGNSLGGGVATEITGQVVGVGPNKIETDTAFVSGNSGSAILDEKGNVLGVATYIQGDSNPEEWSKKGSRFENSNRYFGFRLNDVSWRAMKYDSYVAQCIKKKEEELRDRGIFPQVLASFSSAEFRLKPESGFGAYEEYRHRFIGLPKLHVKASDSAGMPEKMKRPVVRAIVLIDATDGRHVVDFVMNRDSIKCTHALPNWGFVDGSCLEVEDFDGSVNCIEAYSYFQPFVSSKGWNGSTFGTRQDLNRGFFTIYGERDKFKVLTYRLECWQNGGLAGVYNYRKPDILNSRGIPVDWFVKNKYPGQLKYNKLNGEFNTGGRW